VNESIVEGGEDVSNAEDEFAFADLGTESNSLLNGGGLLGSALGLMTEEQHVSIECKLSWTPTVIRKTGKVDLVLMVRKANYAVFREGV
jgi:hypothetical protein